jgi:hypothetical protein
MSKLISIKTFHYSKKIEMETETVLTTSDSYYVVQLKHEEPKSKFI